MKVTEVAKEKAKTAFNIIKKPLIVDDTGLFIDCLMGLPGTFITWFIKKIGVKGIIDLVSPNNREACAVTCIAYHNGQTVHTFSGITNGSISLEPKGGRGFGYDFIFIPAGYTKTFAEMTIKEKRSLSMRKKAVSSFKDFLEKEKYE